MRLLTEDEVREALRSLKKQHRTWQRVEELTGVDKTTCYRIATSDYFPKDAAVRHLLGVGSSRRRKPIDLLSYEPAELLWMLENREVLNDTSEKENGERHSAPL